MNSCASCKCFIQVLHSSASFKFLTQLLSTRSGVDPFVCYRFCIQPPHNISIMAAYPHVLRILHAQMTIFYRPYQSNMATHLYFMGNVCPGLLHNHFFQFSFTSPSSVSSVSSVSSPIFLQCNSFPPASRRAGQV